MRSNNEPSRSQASLARGKACQSRQASQRMSAGPGSKIRALSTPVFSRFAGCDGPDRAVAVFACGPRAWLCCGSVCVRPAGVAVLWQCILRGRSRGAVHGISSRGTGRVHAAPDRECGVFGCRSRNQPRFIRRQGNLHGDFLSFAESARCFSVVRGVCPVLFCCSRSPLCASVINSVHGRWTIDATCL